MNSMINDKLVKAVREVVLGACIMGVSCSCYAYDPSGTETIYGGENVTDASRGHNYVAGIGSSSEVTVDYASLLGYNTKVHDANSVALGALSETSAPKTGQTAQTVTITAADGTTSTFTYAGLASVANGVVSFGTFGNERQLQNVAAGDISSTSTDAVNGSQLYATNSNVGNLTAALNNLKNEINKNGSGSGTGSGTTSNTDPNAIHYDSAAKDSITLGGVNGTKIGNVKDGEISATSKDAVNGSQLYSVQQSVDNNSQMIDRLGSKYDELDNRVDKVGAGAAALAALHRQDYNPDDKFSFAAGVGSYRSEHALAIGAFYTPNEDTTISVGSELGNSDNMWTVGVSWNFGRHGHVTTSKAVMGKKLVALEADNAVMKANNESMKAENMVMRNKLMRLEEQVNQLIAHDKQR
jgi:autotransporter adhesin